MPGLEALLRGTYVYSYSAFFHASPPYKKPIPTLVAVTEVVPKGGKGPSDFPEVPGYGITCYAGFVNFWGNGTLNGGGWSNRGGIDSAYDVLLGSYLVNENAATIQPVYDGTFKTISPDGAEITHYFIAADNFRELKFVIIGTSLRGAVASGVLTRLEAAPIRAATWPVPPA